MEGWIKLHRKFIEWEWFDDSDMVKIFIFLLLKANHKDNKWRGIDVKRGQLITGYKTLSKQLKMSIKVLRNRLKKLELTGEIGRQTGSQFTVITVCNYDSYNAPETKEGKQMGVKRASKGQAEGKQGATNKNEENDNNEKKLIVRSKLFYEQLTPYITEYSKDNIRDFYDYWIEPNKSNTKMRFELERTWSLSARLKRWSKNDFGKKSEPINTDASSKYQVLTLNK